MHKLIVLLASLVAVLAGVPSGFGQCYTLPSPDSNEERIFAQSSCAGVDNNPTNPTIFTIDQPRTITKLGTYHWNDGKGTQTPGTIGLQDQNGKIYGPWQASGQPGQGGVPNAYWIVTLTTGLDLPAGTYTVLDSDSSTWAHNSETDNSGAVSIVGLNVGTGGFPGSTSGQEFKWVGMDADKIGAWDNGNPNGVPDGHFVLNLDLPSSTEIKSILVYSADADGNPVNGQFWDTAENAYYMIGVFDRGTQLNMHHVPTLGTFSGPVQLDLYCEDSGGFKSGSWFGLKVTFGDGTKLERLISI